VKKTITYGTMFRKLQKLGFTKQTVEMRGKPAIVFIHKLDDTALLAFPIVDRKESVSPLHQAMVRGILNSHGISPTNGEPASL
jgi:hypothetical protein